MHATIDPVRPLLLALLLAGCTRSAPPVGDVSAPPEPAPDEVEVDSPTDPLPADPGTTRAVNERDFLPAALAALAAAERRIRVAEFVIYDGAPVDDLLDALVDAAGRGVQVQLLADEEGDETAAILDQLGWQGVEVQLDSPVVTLHNKLIVADDVALVGSHNWTWSALEANQEASVLVADAEVAAWYAAWFDAAWAAPAELPELAPLSRADLQPLADRSIVDAVLGCISGAATRVDVVMYAIAWNDAYPGSAVDQVLIALEEAQARGVALTVVIDGSEWSVVNEIDEAAIARLRAAEIPVWRAPSSVTTHAKVLRCDGSVIVSDANWSYSGLELARGTSLLTTDPALLAQYEAWMDEVRGESTALP